METTPGDRGHGYDNEAEEAAYENAEQAGDPDAGYRRVPLEPPTRDGRPLDLSPAP